jgi:hypothetical protein
LALIAILILRKTAMTYNVGQLYLWLLAFFQWRYRSGRFGDYRGRGPVIVTFIHDQLLILDHGSGVVGKLTFVYNELLDVFINVFFCNLPAQY